MAIKSADQITIVDVTDAYSVILTSEAYTFVGGTSGVASGNSCTTQAMAFCGSTQSNTVNVSVDDITCPTGISAAVTNNGTKSPTITFTTTATVSTACEATIPVSVDGIVVNKKFSFAVAKAGSNGNDGTSVTVSSTSVTYVTSSSGTTTPTSGWQSTVPSVNNGEYLWTKTVVTYSDGKFTTAYGVSYKGTNGTNGSDGADAITMTITSSAGTVFKNNSGSTVLTAHVFVGGVEQSITDAGVCGSYGSVKWYKGSVLASTSKTLTVSASDVTNTMTITAQLE